MADPRIMLIGAMAGSLTGYVGVRLMNLRWRHHTRAEWVGGEMLLKQPPIRSRLGIGLIASLPAILGVGAVIRGPTNPTTFPMIAFLVASGILAGGVLWAIGRRLIIVSSDAIELHGIWGRRISWSDLTSVDALIAAPHHRKLLVFRARKGVTIAVDSTYYGWEEFLEKVSEIAPQAGSKIARAMERLEAGG